MKLKYHISIFIIFTLACSNSKKSEHNTKDQLRETFKDKLIKSDSKIQHYYDLDGTEYYTDFSDTSNGLPFIGIRDFETRHGVSGAGTPLWSVMIDKNRNVIFISTQINKSVSWNEQPKTIIDFYESGKYSKILKCDFNDDNFPRYYVVNETYIYEVDSLGGRISDYECCRLSGELCYCEGTFWSPNPERLSFLKREWNKYLKNKKR